VAAGKEKARKMDVEWLPNGEADIRFLPPSANSTPVDARPPIHDALRML
jgi:hypothetical protein